MCVREMHRCVKTSMLIVCLHIHTYIYKKCKRWLLSILCKSYACLTNPAIYSIPTVCIYLIYPSILLSDTSTLPVYILSQIMSPRRNLESVPNQWSGPEKQDHLFPMHSFRSSFHCDSRAGRQLWYILESRKNTDRYGHTRCYFQRQKAKDSFLALNFWVHLKNSTPKRQN